MQRLRDDRESLSRLDEAWFRRLVALIILLRAIQKMVKKEKFSAYQANIATYTYAALSAATGKRIDFEQVWQRQAASPELMEMLREWSHEIDGLLLRSTAGARMPTEWAKKPEAWEALRAQCPTLPDPLPAELAAQPASQSTTRRQSPSTPGLSASDYAMITEVRAVSADEWLRVAAWGSEGKRLHFSLTGIARTMAEYSLADWKRDPSVK